MADLEQLLTYLTLISVPIGVFYHILMLNNTKKNQQMQLETRQAQLLMNIMNTFRSTEFRKQWHQIEQIQWTDFEDFIEKYEKDVDTMAAWTSVLTFFEGVGVIVKGQLIELDLIYALLGGSVIMPWERFETLIMGDREWMKNYIEGNLDEEDLFKSALDSLENEDEAEAE